MLPLSLAGERSEKERREISLQVHEIEHTYAAHPIEKSKKTKQLLRGNKKILISELITLSIQVIIALMLWRIFAKGLGGEDLHLIYGWMPKVHLPFNLNFLGKFDLTHPHVLLNIIQSVLIAVLETLSIVSSPFPVNRQEVIRLQLTLPIVSFETSSLRIASAEVPKPTAYSLIASASVLAGYFSSQNPHFPDMIILRATPLFSSSMPLVILSFGMSGNEPSGSIPPPRTIIASLRFFIKKFEPLLPNIIHNQNNRRREHAFIKSVVF